MAYLNLRLLKALLFVSTATTCGRLWKGGVWLSPTYIKTHQREVLSIHWKIKLSHLNISH